MGLDGFLGDSGGLRRYLITSYWLMLAGSGREENDAMKLVLVCLLWVKSGLGL